MLSSLIWFKQCNNWHQLLFPTTRGLRNVQADKPTRQQRIPKNVLPCISVHYYRAKSENSTIVKPLPTLDFPHCLRMNGQCILYDDDDDNYDDGGSGMSTSFSMTNNITGWAMAINCTSNHIDGFVTIHTTCNYLCSYSSLNKN